MSIRPEALQAAPVSPARRLAVLADYEGLLIGRRRAAAAAGDWYLVAHLARDHAAVLRDLADAAEAVGN